MDTARVIVAMGNDATNAKIKAFLVEHGYEVVETAQESNECLRKLSLLRPDILVIDSALPGMGGFEVTRVAVDDDNCSVVMITSTPQEYIEENLKDSFRFSYIVKPINKMLLINTLELMQKSGRKIKELEKEVEQLRNAIDSKKEVDRAKRLLMEHLKMSEEEAFKRIQKQSMDKGISMREIAKAIILAYDI